MQNLESYIRNFEAGHISRRQFVERLTGLGLAVPLVTSILAVSSPRVSAATPVKGGRLRIGFTAGSQKEHWDPATRYSRMMNGRNNSVYNTLINVTPDLEAGPNLAES